MTGRAPGGQMLGWDRWWRWRQAFDERLTAPALPAPLLAQGRAPLPATSALAPSTCSVPHREGAPAVGCRVGAVNLSQFSPQQQEAGHGEGPRALRWD